MAAIRDLVAEQRGEPALALTEPLAGVLNRLPTSVSTGSSAAMLRGVDFVTSNVPGAPIPLYAAGGRDRGHVRLRPDDAARRPTSPC